ncbi:MAG: bifunctional 2-C-methyl-D-erythritol 4-phosphate cytidylyltransferase/2-C-methyl-D-erythritol 2,4-cyclodiphosphate synthase, partial [Alphaproteobacteria bacterium]
MKTAALIVAAGRGTRASGALPKQYAHIGGVSVLTRTLGVFLDHPGIDLVQ